DGTPLFPKRRAYTAGYALSPEEVDLYQAVTTYVRDEMNRADRTGDGNRRTSVGFAVQILQRRLASSPAAIHRSLERRRKRLDEPIMLDAATGLRRKIIIFTEPRDTLDYLAQKIAARIGEPAAVVVVHGGVAREARRAAIAAFNSDPVVRVMIANDAAGEGVNLQRGGHLMVNYDLPWNPNRIEQRFGRIHRIGQTEVCHLWNLCASNPREGEVYRRLLDTLEEARAALGGKVYDVLGELFEGHALRDLLVDAIRYGDRPEKKAELFRKVDGAVDVDAIQKLVAERK